MEFDKLELVCFFITVGVGYCLVPPRGRWIWLLAASLFFYGYSDPVFLLQILAATGVSYWVAIRIEQEPDKRIKRNVLTLGILALVANLIVFKYSSFINETFRNLFGWFGASYDIPVIRLLLPIGISFYTFQLIGYLVDVFRGAKAERHFGIFSLYVLLFVKIIAGPIERCRNLLPQLHALQGFSYPLAMAGFQLMLWGALKKVVVADRISPFVNAVYDAPREFNGVAMAFSTWLYAFQIYFDFSGYTDIALGAALIFGINLMQNFNRPYFAISIQDFWKRWHISFTSWLTDFVYTPLTRAKWIKMKLYNLILLSLLVTFVVSGFWHGAQWTFVAWGVLHGTYIVTSLILQKTRARLVRAIGLNRYPMLHRAVRIATTFSLVCFAYIFFRANSLEDAAYIITHLPTGWGDVLGGLNAVVDYDRRPEFLLVLIGILVVMAPEFLSEQGRLGERIAAGSPLRRWSLHYIGIVVLLVFGLFGSNSHQFIYFRF